jgi:hypothetical protein
MLLNILIDKAETLKPELFKHIVKPSRAVHVTLDAEAFQGWRMLDAGSPEDAYVKIWDRSDEIILDFCQYCVGYLSFEIESEVNVDCPLRLKIILGEVPAEIGEDFSGYNGSLGRAWLQEEILVLDDPPEKVRLPRRYAFRYVKISAEYNSRYYIKIKNIQCETVTSADMTAVAALPESFSVELRQIDRISLDTLKNCMQTVFEDGPKRDRRLWLGDFRLQALVNYQSFKNFDLCKRCLYLFAGLADENGLVPSCLFERPQPHSGKSQIYDYTALFAPSLLEYAQASGDWATAAELWPVAERQLRIVLKEVDGDGLFQDNKKWWLFIDWSPQLDKQTAEQGVVIFSLKKALELSKALGREPETWIKDAIVKMSDAALKHLFDQEKRVFVSGRDRQVSWASQAWMTLAGVLLSAGAAEAISTAANTPDAVKPAGPYLYHYIVEAMLAAGMEKDAYALLEQYWGAMVRLGADTFWEVFDPQDQYLSPYKSHIINSYCHAWSCTPAYFLRRQKSQPFCAER